MRCLTVTQTTHVRPGIVPGFDRSTGVLGVQLRSVAGVVTIPLSKKVADAISGMDIVRREQAKFDHVEFDDKGEFLVPMTREEDKSDLALVLVRHPRNEEVVFTAGTWDEKLVNGRVVRVYRQLKDAVGVEPVNLDYTDKGSVAPIDLLLILNRGASFRMERIHAPRDEPRFILYQWRDQEVPVLLRKAPFSKRRNRAAA